MKEKWQEKGQMASAELAIIFPCIMLLVFGVIAFSMFFYDCLKAENAAKSIASRVAAVNSYDEAKTLRDNMRDLKLPEMRGLLVMNWDTDNCNVVYPELYQTEGESESGPQFGSELTFKAEKLSGLLKYVMGDDIMDKNFRFRCYIHNAYYNYTGNNPGS